MCYSFYVQSYQSYHLRLVYVAVDILVTSVRSSVRSMVDRFEQHPPSSFARLDTSELTRWLSLFMGHRVSLHFRSK